jgi:hypothetical protein
MFLVLASPHGLGDEDIREELGISGNSGRPYRQGELLHFSVMIENKNSNN